MDYYKKALKEEAVYVQDYQDVTCYTRKGLTEDSFVVYVTYDVKFNRVDTLAPGIMWCCVAKDRAEAIKSGKMSLARKPIMWQSRTGLRGYGSSIGR